MVWCCMSASGEGKHEITDGIMTAEKNSYAKIPLRTTHNPSHVTGNSDAGENACTYRRGEEARLSGAEDAEMAGTFRQYLASILCQMSVLVAGATYSWFEPITLRLTQDPELLLTPEDVSWLIASVEVGYLIGPFVAGDLTDKVGRKYLIFSVGPLCTAGWLMLLYSKSLPMIVAVRIIHGLAGGFAFAIAPIYTAEIAEPELHGHLSGTFQTAWYLGSLIVFSLGPYLSYDTYIYACLSISILFTIVSTYLPETPYFLLMTGRDDQTKKVLKWLREGSDVEEDMTNLQAVVKEEIKVSWKLLFTDKVERKAFFIVQVISFTKLFTGMPVIVSYAMETFAKSDSFLPPEEMSIILGFLLIGISIISTFMSDWIGRKPLLLISCFGCFFAHLFTGSYYYIHEKTSIDSSSYIWMMYLGLVMYCFFCDIGLGPLLQTLQSEMFGASTRGVAGGITKGLAAIFAFLILKAYTPVNETFGVFLNFWFYSASGLVGGLLLIWFMCQTAGKTIGQMMEKKPISSS